jgi:hypothetical protein
VLTRQSWWLSQACSCAWWYGFVRIRMRYDLIDFSRRCIYMSRLRLGYRCMWVVVVGVCAEICVSVGESASMRVTMLCYNILVLFYPFLLCSM